MAIERRAHATWEGDLRSGSGRFDLTSSVSMALANGLAQDGHAPTRLETDAVATLDQTDEGFRITSMHLTVRGEVEGIDESAFQEAAQTAKEGCPVSNALGGVEITIEASLT